MSMELDIQLLPHHRKELIEGSGLTEETILRAGIHSETNAHRIRAILNWPKMPARAASGIVIPFVDHDGKPTGYSRFKPDNPRTDRTSGKAIKYESPRDVPNRVYYPPDTIPALDDAPEPLIISEGEKKALKADQEGFRCIGLVGVFAWKAKGCEQLLPELDLIEWKGRSVFIAFDSDAATNENVADAECRLCAQLVNRGASVRVVRLPAGPSGEKVGLDDYLMAFGANGLHQLLNSAEAPSPVENDVAGKADAKSVDAMREARRLLATSATVKEGKDEWHKLHAYRGSWHWHTGTHYREEADTDLEAKVVQHLDPDFYRLTKSAVANVTMALKAETNVSSHREMPTWLDGKREGVFLPMTNGILNVSGLLKGEADVIEPHTPRYFSSNCLPYEFDPAADCPKWLAFLDRNLEGDAERIALIQQFYGYCLSPALTAHKFLFHEGEGANGKSVACAVLTAMIGTANVSSVPLESFGERFSLFQTLGKLANVASEVGEIDRVAEGTLKAFTSGDALQFERKHRDPITARPTAKLVFASNNRPRFSDKSGGLWRRMILMPWRIVIPEGERVRGMDSPQWWQDQGELPGILLWAIAGLWQLEQQGGFTKSSVCEAALSEYRVESNPTRQFLEERFHFDPESWVVCEHAYRPYVDWVKANGFMPLSSSTFGHEVRRAFPLVERRKKLIGTDRPMAYFGLRFQP